MSPPVLLTLTSRSIPGGMETHAKALQKAFPGLEIKGREDLSRTPGILDKIGKEPPIAKALAEQLALKKDPPSIVFSNGMMGAFVSQNLPDSVPRVTLLHGTFRGLAEQAYSKWDPLYWRMRYWYASVEKQAAQTAHVNIANSSFTASEVRTFYGVKSRVVEPPINSTLFSTKNKSSARKKVKWSAEEKHILFVGNPTHSKGFDIVLALAAANPQWTFDLICVPAPAISLSNVRVHKPMPLNELADYYRAADVVLFPSRYEGFGFVPLEALACGTPVIASTVGILPEIHVPHLIRVSHELSAFSHALNETITNPPNGKKNASEITKRFTVKAFARGIKDAIEETKSKKGNFHA